MKQQMLEQAAAIVLAQTKNLQSIDSAANKSK